MGIEQPRCTLCGHRRIYHFRMIANKRTQREIMTHCSIPDCDCIVYIPHERSERHWWKLGCGHWLEATGVMGKQWCNDCQSYREPTSEYMTVVA